MQHECIPQAILGMDVICQAKSGMGKTAVFALSTLNQLEPDEKNPHVAALILCHTRELAYQVRRWRRAPGGCFRLNVQEQRNAALCFLPFHEQMEGLLRCLWITCPWPSSSSA